VLADISQPIYEYTAKIAHQVPVLYDPLQKTGAVPVAREQRKLAAILAADVVGYSRLMGLGCWQRTTELVQRRKT
jgi:class 3 adenylate cyclase